MTVVVTNNAAKAFHPTDHQQAANIQEFVVISPCE